MPSTELKPLNRDHNYMDERGANALASRIRAYWRTKGLFPDVWVEPVSLTVNFGQDRIVHQVRSNIRVAGLWTGKFA